MRGPGSVRRAGVLTLVGLLTGLLGVQAEDPAAGELDCLIEPQQTVVVSAAVAGVVESMRVDRGDLVEEGQVLATLEASVERAAVQSARARAKATAEFEGSKARYALEQRHFERTKQLLEQGVASDGVLDEAEMERIAAEVDRDRARENLELAGLDLRQAEAILERKTVRSPVKGVVVKRMLAPGEYGDPPQLLEIAQIDPLRVEVFAPVSLLGAIEVGASARVMPEEPVGGVHEARVVVVDRVLDAASGTFGVRLELPNPDYELPAGLKCRVRF